MDEEYLQKKLNVLWDKVQDKKGLASAFESAQAEIQAESLNLLRSRFDKEKSYWENLIAAKEETINRFQIEIQDAQKKNEELKLKIAELQNGQAMLLQQSFSTLDLQKRSLNARIEQTENELEGTRREIMDLTLNLKEEKDLREKFRREYEEKEAALIAENQKREEEIEKVRQDLFQRRQSELDETSRLDETIKDLQNQLQENKNLFAAEKAGMQNLFQEKEGQLAKIQQDLDQTQSILERERDERRLAAVEREKQTVQGEEEKKRLVEQLLVRENKIKELQESLERLIAERAVREESLKKKEDELLLQEESLRKRREDWVESIKDQSGEQLSISGKIVELLNKLDLKLSIKTRPSSPAVIAGEGQGAAPRSGSAIARMPAAQGSAGGAAVKPAAKFSPFSLLPNAISGSPMSIKAQNFFSEKKGVALLTTGLFLFAATSLLLFFEGEGQKSMRAHRYLVKGNEQFTKGDLEKASQYLEKAYGLDPENSIIKNSLTLVFGEMAHKEFQEGKLEDALKHAEFVYKVLPEDPNIIQLHTAILQALGRAPSEPDVKTDVKLDSTSSN